MKKLLLVATCLFLSLGLTAAAVAQTTISISDTTAVEGDSGTKLFGFIVTIAQTQPFAVGFNYATEDSSATVGDSDFAGKSGPGTIAAGQQSTTIDITVQGDTKYEDDEIFTMKLSNLSTSFVTFAADDSVGVGTITNDDAAVISIAAIPGVTAPAVGASQDLIVADTAEYTSTISWLPDDNPYLGEKVYTATITVTPKTGFTLTGVAANFFTVAGATATNPINNGVVTAVFPATAPAVISIDAIPGVTAPVTGVSQDGTVDDTAEYTSTISWLPDDNPYLGEKVYTATITVTPKTGFTLTGVAANFFTVAGASATNPINNGVVEAVFPATAATISIAAIPGVTAPVSGVSQDGTVDDTAQYTSTISWSPDDDPFDGATVYTATITVSPKTGFTLSGVAANFFTVAGASATNPINNGVVTAVFPATAADPTFVSAATNVAGTFITITFDKDMSDPTGKHGEFNYQINGLADQPFSSAALNADPTKIDLEVNGTAIAYGYEVNVKYTAGTVTADDTGVLATFGYQAVTINMLAPEMQITGLSDLVIDNDPEAEPSEENGTDFGDALVYEDEEIYRTFTIKNPGLGTIVDLNVSLEAGIEFWIEDIVGDTEFIDPGEEVDVTVGFYPESRDDFEDLFIVESNLPDYLFMIEGTGIAPVLQVSYYDTESWDVVYLDTDSGVYFGEMELNTGINSIEFTIANEGDADLIIYEEGPPIWLFLGDYGFEVTEQPTMTTIAPGAETYFTVLFDPDDGDGEYYDWLNFYTNDYSQDGMEGPGSFSYRVEGNGIYAPEIDVSMGSTAIATITQEEAMFGPFGDSERINFGSVVVGSSQTKTFTIENLGSDMLLLGEEVFFFLKAAPKISGTDQFEDPVFLEPIEDLAEGVFEIVEQPSEFLEPDESTTFKIKYTPSKLGAEEVFVIFPNNDPDEGLWGGYFNGDKKAAKAAGAEIEEPWPFYVFILQGVGSSGGAGAITLLSPNGGETWASGSSQFVVWDSGPGVGMIEASVDGGTTWSLVAEDVNLANGSYPVTVAELSSPDCLVRITTTDGTELTDTSD
ncbi:choice-of-anchor D domain-containing protein, partial [Candidatus Latescibacterota bacterium]